MGCNNVRYGSLSPSHCCRCAECTQMCVIQETRSRPCTVPHFKFLHCCDPHGESVNGYHVCHPRHRSANNTCSLTANLMPQSHSHSTHAEPTNAQAGQQLPRRCIRAKLQPHHHHVLHRVQLLLKGASFKLSAFLSSWIVGQRISCINPWHISTNHRRSSHCIDQTRLAHAAPHQAQAIQQAQQCWHAQRRQVIHTCSAQGTVTGRCLIPNFCIF